MMREVVGSLMAVTISVMLLWFILPMLNTAYESVKTMIDLDNPTNQNMLAIGDGVYLVLPFIALIVTGYLIFAYATRSLPTDL